MNEILAYIKYGASRKIPFLAVLLDPDKLEVKDLPRLLNKIHKSATTHILVGGSTVKDGQTQEIVSVIKQLSHLPIIIFPGDTNQICEEADAILFLSLLSGNNPDYLIGKHVEAVPKLLNSDLEIIPTAYILVENGKATAVEKVTETVPIPNSDINQVVHTAKAGEFLGMQLCYLEAGSGANQPIPVDIIKAVKSILNIPLIIGGGINNMQGIQKAYDAGADMVVIGTAFENDPCFFETTEKINQISHENIR
ncbi:geranylgeranylglyceryl/heptaprenylglyceryl phosphate synthase [Aegicerativicinus sediminis]|uniref:geranylgeranylglyceryl/heptaprenylglyceryl phosphate synthase n=1 Tax=Aegicerativicinus sediminis TaxID=2893202 RepID=UPI001E5C1FBE|nr:geranylgeranylglyceryl/heptaprenylglyceryl phosphate synthase [Aegicerativicinus sediminis]